MGEEERKNLDQIRPTPYHPLGKQLPERRDMDYPDYREPPEEDFLRNEQRRNIHPMTELPPVRDGIPALVFFMAAALISTYAWQHSWFYQWCVPTGNLVFEHGAYWKLVTGIFLHADMAHLMSNAPLFLIFGWFLRAYFGSLAFPILAFTVGVITHGITLATYHPQTKLVGASGMLYAMVSMWMGLYIRHSTTETLGSRVFRSLGFTLALMLPSTFEPRTSYMAHGVGFGLGLIAAISFPRKWR